MAKHRSDPGEFVFAASKDDPLACRESAAPVGATSPRRRHDYSSRPTCRRAEGRQLSWAVAEGTASSGPPWAGLVQLGVAAADWR